MHKTDIINSCIDNNIILRLSYDEILAHQIATTIVRYRVDKSQGRSIKGNNVFQNFVIKKLGFELYRGTKASSKRDTI